jgi:hypothetical protein
MTEGETIDVDAAATELVEFVRNLVKPWVDFRGHEQRFAEIIRRHRTPLRASDPD